MPVSEPLSYCLYCMEPMPDGAASCPRCGKMPGAASALPHQLRPGAVLSDRYLVGPVLGEGGFGLTYLCRDLNLDMRVAVKEYYPSGLVNRNHTHSDGLSANTGEAGELLESGKSRFLDEARILARFAGESGVVGVRDFFKANNTAYIVMDYLEGVTLKTWLEDNGAPAADWILESLKPVMGALSRIHAQGLIHRDISPDNLMLTKDGLKLLDFGAARHMSGADDKTLSVMLKRGYAPEEQYRSKGVQGAWTDVYALCATIYKCITGVKPEDAMQRIFSDALEAPSALGARISAAQEAVLLKGMAVVQKNRYQTMGELSEAFFGTAQEAPQVTAPQGPTPQDKPPQDGPAQDGPSAPAYDGAAIRSFADDPTMAVGDWGEAPSDKTVAAIAAQPPEAGASGRAEQPGKKKHKRLARILAIAGACLFALLLAVILWNAFGSLRGVTIGDTGQLEDDKHEVVLQPNNGYIPPGKHDQVVQPGNRRQRLNGSGGLVK